MDIQFISSILHTTSTVFAINQFALLIESTTPPLTIEPSPYFNHPPFKCKSAVDEWKNGLLVTLLFVQYSGHIIC